MNFLSFTFIFVHNVLAVYTLVFLGSLWWYWMLFNEVQVGDAHLSPHTSWKKTAQDNWDTKIGDIWCEEMYICSKVEFNILKHSRYLKKARGYTAKMLRKKKKKNKDEEISSKKPFTMIKISCLRKFKQNYQ